MGNNIVVDFLGDICLSEYEGDINNLNEMAEHINNLLGNVDYRIADLEAPFTDKEMSKITKMGPNLKMDYSLFPFFERININGWVLANNHIGDYGIVGISDTIEKLESLNVDYTGASSDTKNVYEPIRKIVKGKRISIFSFCENEFGTSVNDILGGVAGYEMSYVKELITLEKNQSDYIFVVFHGGTEYYPFPTPMQRERYRMLVDWGGINSGKYTSTLP